MVIHKETALKIYQLNHFQTLTLRLAKMVKILGEYLWGRHSALSAPNHPKIGGDQLCGLCYWKMETFCDSDPGIHTLPSDSSKIPVIPVKC